MTLALTLLARALGDADDARFLLPRLALERRPHDRVDAAELAMWHALAPLVTAHPGNAVAVRTAAPARWHFAIDTAVALPDWWHLRCGPLDALVTRWATYGGMGWELPSDPSTRAAA